MMMELTSSPLFGVTLTIAAYWIGMAIQKKVNKVICNGMLIAVVLVILTLTVLQIPYENYYQGGSLINLFLGPATACLAVSIYMKIDLLKKYWLPVVVGCSVGTVTAAVAGGHGGIVSLAVAAVCFTGIIGNLCAPLMIRLFRVREPLAAGLGIGACSHAMGTAKALELGETEGAMSGLAIGLCGLLTSLLSLIFDLLP